MWHQKESSDNLCVVILRQRLVLLLICPVTQYGVVPLYTAIIKTFCLTSHMPPCPCCTATIIDRGKHLGDVTRLIVPPGRTRPKYGGM